MFKIFYNDIALINVDDFVLYLKKYYKNIYFDTGLVNEDQILRGYIDNTEKLFDEIIFTIESTIEKGYFGNIYETTEIHEKSRLVLRVRSYTIKVLLKRVGNNIRIEDIVF